MPVPLSSANWCVQMYFVLLFCFVIFFVIFFVCLFVFVFVFFFSFCIISLHDRFCQVHCPTAKGSVWSRTRCMGIPEEFIFKEMLFRISDSMSGMYFVSVQNSIKTDSTFS